VNISIVVISFNSSTFLDDNIHSLTSQTVPFREIVIVDNASQDDSQERVQTLQNKFHQLTLIPLERNFGYAGAANKGINSLTADSELVVVANPDTIFDETFNEKVIAKMTKDPDIAMLSPLILRFDKTTVDSAGQECSSALYPREKGYNRPLSDVDVNEGPVFSVCGAATVFRRRALEQLKLYQEYYDEDFFIFWEDFDMGWRARSLGLKVWFFPDALVYHFRSGTLKRNFLSRFSLALSRPAFIKYHLVKNRFLVLIKNFRFGRDFRHLPFMILKDLVWVTMLTFGAPKIIIPLMKSGKYFKRMVIKRKEMTKRLRDADRNNGKGNRQ